MKEKLQKIQKEIGVMKKDTEGYNYKFFDINQLLEKLQPILEKHKVVISQPMVVKEGATRLCTVLYDLESEELIESAIQLPNDVKPQDMGSAITYYRRYSIVSLLALQAEDDDGASTMKKTASKKIVDKGNDL